MVMMEFAPFEEKKEQYAVEPSSDRQPPLDSDNMQVEDLAGIGTEEKAGQFVAQDSERP
jgi:hypothetical protein